MKSSSFAFVFALVGATFVFADDSTSQVTPVQKVVELMNGMLKKGVQEKQAEQVQFAEYKTFCENTAADKEQSIKEANERIDMLKADIGKLTTDAERLATEIASHDEDIAVWEGDKKAVTKVRTMEKIDYDAMHKDYTESIDALNMAIAVLKKQAHNRPQAGEKGASLVQVAALTSFTLIPKEAKRAIEAFIQQDPVEGLAVSAPEAYGYEFQSHGVVALLEELLDKFIAERTTLEKEEMNTVGAYEMLMQDLVAQIAKGTSDRDAKAKQRAEALQAKADAEGDLDDTTSTRDEDVRYLNNLVATCEQKATDFESRQTLRVQELKAVQKAIEIVESQAVQGNADTYLPSLLQVKSSSFAALRSNNEAVSRVRLTTYLRQKSMEVKSRILAAVADHAENDPFRKVQKMIKDLITRLMEEANEETEHKGWCDTELGTNEKTRIEKTQAVETLHAEIDELKASITKLTEEIQALTEAVAELDAAMSKATKLRAEEKAKNTQTMEDAKEAQVAVAQALLVLKEFYAKAAEATALLQQQPEAPEIFDAPYQGMQSENGGIVGMLEVIMSDFARLEATTKSAEVSAVQQYETFMEESKIDKAKKTESIKHKSNRKQNEKKALVTKEGDLEGNQKELDAALIYYDKLKPSCISTGESYEERVVRRQEEIDSLRDALRILNGEEFA